MRQSEDKNAGPDPGCHPMRPFRAVRINRTSGIAAGNFRSAAQDCRNKTAGLRLSANLHRRTGKRPADHRRHAAVRPQTDIFSALDRSWQGVNRWYRSSHPGCPEALRFPAEARLRNATADHFQTQLLQAVKGRVSLPAGSQQTAPAVPLK